MPGFSLVSVYCKQAQGSREKQETIIGKTTTTVLKAYFLNTARINLRLLLQKKDVSMYWGFEAEI